MHNETDTNTALSCSDETSLIASASDRSLNMPTNTNLTLTKRPLIVEDVLIEEVSIDGMCGVY